MRNIYLDYAATTPLDENVLAAMMPFLQEKFGNASSIHYFGQQAKAAIEESRSTVAKSLNAANEEIVFTGSGTEANNFALKGVAFAHQKKGKHIITSKTEHHAVLEPLHYLEEQGFLVTYLEVDTFGNIDLAQLKSAITPETVLISIMHGNNEMGTIAEIEAIAKIAKEREIIFHTDAVQTFGKVALDVQVLGVDLLSISAHKLYGPKGVGALYVRSGVRLEIFMHGGAQERGRRAATENVAAIVGFAKAVEIAMANLAKDSAKIAILRDRFVAGIFKAFPDAVFNGHPTKRLVNNLNVSFKYLEGETILLNLDMEGICASSGSACTAGSTEPSHVLIAMGLTPEIAYGSVRFTLGKYTTQAEIDTALEKLTSIVNRLKQRSPFYK